MKFNGLNLNLLRVLQVLLAERNVSRAATLLHLTQPSVSASLAQLRDYFRDPLLVTNGRSMLPTALAMDLLPELHSIIHQVEALMVRSQQFDPRTSDRMFRIAASDYILTVIFTKLVPDLKRKAPNLRLDLQPPVADMPALLDKGEFDLILTPEEFCQAEHPVEPLFEDRHVIAGWRKNPLMKRPVSLESFLEAPHITVSFGSTRRISFAESHLHKLGLERRVEVFCSSFTHVPELLVGTDRIAILQERLVKAFAARHAIAWQPLPFDFPVMREAVQFHRARAHDAGLRWLRESIRSAAASPLTARRIRH